MQREPESQTAREIDRAWRRKTTVPGVRVAGLVLVYAKSMPAGAGAGFAHRECCSQPSWCRWWASHHERARQPQPGLPASHDPIQRLAVDRRALAAARLADRPGRPRRSRGGSLSGSCSYPGMCPVKAGDCSSAGSSRGERPVAMMRRGRRGTTWSPSEVRDRARAP